MSDHARVLAALDSASWVIQAQWLETIYAIAARDLDALTPEVLERRAGTPMRQQPGVEVRDGVAVVNVTGPIFRYANLFTDMSGATSHQRLALQFQAAVDDPAVKGIVLQVDSPGGMVDGTAEMAGAIREARQHKPVVAYVDGTAASGAYWLASAAGRIVISPTAMLGSIGCAVGVRATDPGEAARRIEFVSAVSPNKRLTPESDAGRASYQRIADTIGAIFVETVAENRGVSAETVVADFGGGGVLIGAAAVAAGMADSVGSLEAVIAELAGGSAAGGKMERSMDWSKVTAADLRANAGAAVTEIETAAAAKAEAAHGPALAAAKAEGARAERERVLGLEAMAMDGHEDLLAAAKADGATTAEQFAVQMVKAEKARGGRHLDARADHERGPQPPAAVTNGNGPAAAPEGETPEARADREWASDAKLRAEFGDKGAYAAFLKADAGGNVRILKRG